MSFFHLESLVPIVGLNVVAFVINSLHYKIDVTFIL